MIYWFLDVAPRRIARPRYAIVIEYPVDVAPPPLEDLIDLRLQFILSSPHTDRDVVNEWKIRQVDLGGNRLYYKLAMMPRVIAG